MTDIRIEQASLDHPRQSLPPIKQRFGLKAFLGTFGTSLFVQACTVLQGVIVARLLGVVGRGEFAAAILWPNLFASIGIMGTHISIACIAGKSGACSSLYRSALVLSLLTSIPVGLICLFTTPLLLPAAESQIVGFSQIFTIYILIYHAKMNLIYVDKGAGKFGIYNVSRAILNPVYLGILGFLWLFDMRSAKWFVIALLLANAIDLFFRSYLAFSRVPLVGSLYPVKTILRQGVRFALAGMADPFYQQIDKILLLWLLGSRDLGLYMVALSASAVVGSVTDASGIVSFTMAAQAGSGEGFERIAKAFRMSLLLWIILGGLLACMMPWVLPLVYSSLFSEAIAPARLLIIGSAFAGLSHLLEESVRGQGRAFVGLEGRAFGLVAMALGGILLSSPLGITGICVAYIAGQSICLGVILRRVNQHYGIRGIAGYIPRVNEFRELSVRIGNQLLARIRTRPADGRSA